MDVVNYRSVNLAAKVAKVRISQAHRRDIVRGPKRPRPEALLAKQEASKDEVSRLHGRTSSVTDGTGMAPEAIEIAKLAPENGAAAG